MSIGIWGHGRHLETKDWERLAWGDPAEQRLGTLPTMVRVALDAGFDSVEAFGLGTGLSQKDGLYEAQLLRQLLLDRIGDLEAFDIIREHREFEWPNMRQRARRLVNEAILDLKSQNTAEEIGQAAKLFSERGVTQVIQVTCGSHAARCMAGQVVARHNGSIPRGQRWSVVADDMLFAGATAVDTLVFEPAHRADDPVAGCDRRPVDVFRQFFGLPAAGKCSVLPRIDTLLNEHGS
jgi:hypothetical protein